MTSESETLEERLLKCIAEARRLGNQGVTEMRESNAHRRNMDALLAGTAFDDPEARFDAPERTEHRRYQERVFNWRKGSLDR